MARNNGSTNRSTSRPQASKQARYSSGPIELDLMVRFTASRNRDREGMGR